MNENDFGYRIRQALDEGLERLDYRTTYRLQQARQAALARQFATRPKRHGYPPLGRPPARVPRPGRACRLAAPVGLAAPLLALAIGFVGIYEYQGRSAFPRSPTWTSPCCWTTSRSRPTRTRGSVPCSRGDTDDH